MRSHACIREQALIDFHLDFADNETLGFVRIQTFKESQQLKGRSPSSSLLPKPVTYSKFHGKCPGWSWISHTWRFHNLLVQHVKMLHHPHSKKFFLIFIWNMLCSSFFPLPLVLLLHTTENSPAPPMWLSHFRYGDSFTSESSLLLA